jgi:hypothetical protein
MTTINVPQNLIGNVALVAGGLRVGVDDDVGGEASGRAGLSVVVDGVVVKFLPRISEETTSFSTKERIRQMT